MRQTDQYSNNMSLRKYITSDGDYLVFSINTDDHALYERAYAATLAYGRVITRIIGGPDDYYHRSEGYRDYALWSYLDLNADTNKFLLAIFPKSS